MRTIKVNKGELIATVLANRGTHIAEYNSACEGYKAAAIRRIEEVASDIKAQVERLRQGEMLQVASVRFNLTCPVTHEKDYDQLIKELEMSVDQIIELSSEDFGRFVMDDWEWKETWKASNAMYLSQ